ncbi:helix-turn-helix domain-containing protein [Streptomyces sp. NPDC050625]|uniref:helix-turn-helix domain-containing protein n=1 Tax=Streptomyces sp. NPDC050625 TaxID=3154629 RepID=UPI00342D11E1
MHDDELLTVPDVLRRLKLGRSTVYDLIRSRRLPSMAIGRCRPIRARAVHDYSTNEL